MAAAKRIMLVCSSGGHLLQLHTLSLALGSEHNKVWDSFNKSDARSILKDEECYWAHFPTNRNVLNLIRNAVLSCQLLSSQRPDIVMSTGAGIAVPFLIMARLFGAKSVYIESFARKDDLSLSGKLLDRFVDRFYVQHDGLTKKYKNAIFRGSIY